MSWLYSVIFAGLLFGSGSEIPVISFESAPETAAESSGPARQDVTEKFDQTYPLNPDGRVSLTNINGSVTVEAWDRNEVRVEATKIANSQEALNSVTIDVNARSNSIRIEADYGNWNFRGSENERRRVEIQFKLSVPRTASLNSIETVNGSVTLSNFVNFAKVSAVNGNVMAENLRGTANLSTVNGEVKADFDRLEAGTNISLNTVNGAVKLVLPSDANAMVKADSLNGDISNEFGLPVKKGQFIGRSLHGRLGNGGVQIRLNSVNGPLSIGRRKDGRQPSPATNLLTPGKDDDFNVDVDIDIDEKAALNAARISDRQAARIANDVKREMERVRPELEKAQAAIDTTALNARIAETQRIAAENLAVRTEALSRIAEIAWSPRAPAMRKQTNSFPVGKKPSVQIEGKGCNVSVRGWDKDEVRYVFTEVGRNGGPSIKVTEEATADRVVLRAGAESEKYDTVLAGYGEVRLDVMVPRHATVKITSARAVRVQGVSGNVEIEGSEESVDVRDVSGALRINALDPQVRVIGFAGAVESRLRNGDLFLEGDFEKIDAVSNDGNVILTIPDTAVGEFASNTEVRADGLPVMRDGSKIVRLGSGGPRHSFTFTRGQLVLRNLSALNIN